MSGRHKATDKVRGGRVTMSPPSSQCVPSGLLQSQLGLFSPQQNQHGDRRWPLCHPAHSLHSSLPGGVSFKRNPSSVFLTTLYLGREWAGTIPDTHSLTSILNLKGALLSCFSNYDPGADVHPLSLSPLPVSFKTSLDGGSTDLKITK